VNGAARRLINNYKNNTRTVLFEDVVEGKSFRTQLHGADPQPHTRNYVQRRRPEKYLN